MREVGGYGLCERREAMGCVREEGDYALCERGGRLWVLCEKREFMNCVFTV